MSPLEHLPPDLGQRIACLHDQALAASDGPPLPDAAPAGVAPLWPAAPLLQHWVCRNHHFNSCLWAEEDLARRTRVSDSEIAANKRAIDGFNQARNDATERIDEILLIHLGLVDAQAAQTDAPLSKAPPSARLNSETAGSIIDRMSIMALKIFAMRQQTLRADADEAHRQSAQIRLDRLIHQRADLASCLDQLLADTQAGSAYFKVYRQFKMYNDPRFNPVLVAEQASR